MHSDHNRQFGCALTLYCEFDFIRAHNGRLRTIRGFDSNQFMESSFEVIRHRPLFIWAFETQSMRPLCVCVKENTRKGRDSFALFYDGSKREFALLCSIVVNLGVEVSFYKFT